MICEHIAEQIPALIRREINTEQRIAAVKHIQSCPKCRSEYLSQLKIFYEIDKNLVSTADLIDPVQLKNDLQNSIEMEQIPKKTNFNWYISIAASLLIISLVIWILKPAGKNFPLVKNESPEKVIQKALEKEDWPYLQKILVSGKELNQYANEQIPLNLLISKLQRLERTGVQAISFTELFDEAQNTKSQPENNRLVSSGKNEIRIDFLIKTLKDVSPYTTETSLKEISTFIEKNKPGGTDS
jgi:hypothetical protein